MVVPDYAIIRIKSEDDKPQRLESKPGRSKHELVLHYNRKFL
jgi:hypothetical protein